MEHFNQIIRLLLKNALILAILPLTAMVSLWFLTKDQPRKYEVKSKFLYDFDGESTSVSGESLNLQEIYTEFLNTLEIIKSRKLIEKLRAQIALESVSGSSEVFNYEWPDSLALQVKGRLLEILQDKSTPYLDDAKEAIVIQKFYDYHKLSSEVILEAISAHRIQTSNFLEIKMLYTNPKQVFYMSNLLNDLVTKEIGNIDKKNISKQKAVIEELVKKAKKELDEKVLELENLKVQNNIINLDEHTKAIVTYQVQLEQLRGTIRQQIASTRKAKDILKSGIENNEFAAVNQEVNKSIVDQKNDVYSAQDLKLVHLQKDIDYSQLIQQQQSIYKNYTEIKRNLRELSKNAVYDPTMVHTGMTMQFIDFKVKSDRLEDELVEIDKEIARVKRYASYFAPFESAISTLRDEISTAQKTYLLFLNKLNITESLEVGASRSKLELVDHPEFPIEPLPSKTKLIILAGGMAVFVLLAAFIMINYLIDNRIKDVVTFERRVGGNVIAALPAFPQKSDDHILEKALNLINTEGVKKVCREIGKNQTIAINALTTADDAAQLVEGLKAYWKNEKVEVLSLTGEKEEIKKEITEALKSNDRLICLASPLQFSYDGINVAEVADCSLLNFTLGRITSSADARVIRDYEQANANHKGFILSGLLPEYMDTYVGELPKRRNGIRRVIKKLVNRDFSWG